MTITEHKKIIGALTCRQPWYDDFVNILKKYYSKNPVGGTMHLVLDDGNIKNDDIGYCLLLAIRDGDVGGELIARTMLLMSKTQRRKVVNNYINYAE